MKCIIVKSQANADSYLYLKYDNHLKKNIRVWNINFLTVFENKSNAELKSENTRFLTIDQVIIVGEIVSCGPLDLYSRRGFLNVTDTYILGYKDYSGQIDFCITQNTLSVSPFYARIFEIEEIEKLIKQNKIGGLTIYKIVTN